MNEVLILGKIEDIRFEFMYDSEYISICIIKLKLKNQSMIEAYGYDEIADKMIQKLKKGNIILINGKLRNEGMVEITSTEEFAKGFL